MRVERSVNARRDLGPLAGRTALVRVQGPRADRGRGHRQAGDRRRAAGAERRPGRGPLRHRRRRDLPAAVAVHRGDCPSARIAARRRRSHDLLADRRDPPLLRADRGRGRVRRRGQRVDFGWSDGKAPIPAGAEARPIAAEQSNSSVVFGENAILKIYRRVEAGDRIPELEMLRFLDAPAASARSRRCSAGTSTAARPRGGDARRRPGVHRRRPRRLGVGARPARRRRRRPARAAARARPHDRRDAHRAGRRPRPTRPSPPRNAAPTRPALWSPRSTSRSTASSSPCPTTPGWRRSPAARRSCATSCGRFAGDRRRDGDPRPRRPPPRPDAARRPRLDDPRLRGRARPAAARAARQALAPARRRRPPALDRLRAARRPPAARRRAAGGLGGARPGRGPRRIPGGASTRRCCRRPATRSTSCSRSTNWRKPSTS